MWFRLQIVVIFAACLYAILSLKKGDDSEIMIFYLIGEVVNAFFSGLACLSYAIIVYSWIKKTQIETFGQLKLILHHAGWINACVWIAGILSVSGGLKLFLHISFKDVQEIAIFTLIPILIGQVAILWTIKRCVTFEKEISPQVESLIEEIGQN
jgi:ABC-type enterochelin transport system permease subunit